MKANFKEYKLENSLKRIDDILSESNNSFQSKDDIPDRNTLTYNNGYYVYCASLFVDIRNSSSMTDEHTRPVLAKIYKSFISEMVALMNGYEKTHEVNINGDCVWCVCEAKFKSDIDQLFSLSAKVCSLVDILNYKLKKKGYQTYKVGVGMDYGRALMIKAGYNGSGINDVIWMGDVVNKACHLCNQANEKYNDQRVFLSNIFYDNLNKENQNLCTKDYIRDIYQANIVNVEMNQWLANQN